MTGGISYADYERVFDTCCLQRKEIDKLEQRLVLIQEKWEGASGDIEELFNGQLCDFNSGCFDVDGQCCAELGEAIMRGEGL